MNVANQIVPAGHERIDLVHIGNRHRKDLGDIDALAESIKEVGLLHPIVVTSKRKLVAGERRLAACRSLGWDNIPVTVVDLKELARGEAAENFQRKDFTPSEAVAIKRAIEPEIKEAAKQRMSDGGKGVQLAQPSDGGRAADRAAVFTGYAARTLDKAEAIVAAAEAEPERFGKLVDDMDRTGRVDGPFKRLKVMKQAEAIRQEPPPLPQRGPYRVIVADPPWPYELRKEDPSHRATHPYPQMSLDQIRTVDVAGIAHSCGMNALAPADTRLDEFANEIRGAHFSAIQFIGKRLKEAQELFRYDRDEGGFSGWVEANLTFSVRTAYSIIEKSETLGVDNVCEFFTLSPTAFRLLSAPETQPQIREVVADRLAAGEKVPTDEIAKLNAELAAREGDLRLAHDRDAKRLREIAKLSSKLRDAESGQPQEIVVAAPDFEPWKAALTSIWRQAPSPVRQWFFEEFQTPFCAPKTRGDPVAESIDADTSEEDDDDGGELDDIGADEAAGLGGADRIAEAAQNGGVHVVAGNGNGAGGSAVGGAAADQNGAGGSKTAAEGEDAGDPFRGLTSGRGDAGDIPSHFGRCPLDKRGTA